MELSEKKLPPELRQAILDHIRQEVGRDEYRRMVENAGEDNIVRLLDAKAIEKYEAEKSRAETPRHQRGLYIGCLGLVTVAGLYLAGRLFFTDYSPSSWWEHLLVVPFMGLVALLFWGWCFHLSEERPVLFWSLLGGILLTVVILALLGWLLGPTG